MNELAKNDFIIAVMAMAVVMIIIALYDAWRGKRKQSCVVPKAAYTCADLQEDFRQAILEISEEELTGISKVTFTAALSRVIYFANDTGETYIAEMAIEELEMVFTAAKHGLLSQEMETL